jgi:hypothetical protein
MSAPFLQKIDWQRPWLTPFRACAEPLLQADDWRTELNALASAKGLYNHRHLPIHFVPQASLPPDTSYEAFISTTGGVPTRDNLHDFFNALMWLTFPQIKIRLNALQAGEIAKGQDKTRGKLRDAATIFDENAALLVVRDSALIEALRARRWHEVFITQRDAFEGGCELWLFGHALMEKLNKPYKGITAHAWPVPVDATFFGMSLLDKRNWLDATVAHQLANGLTTADFTPLPVLGIPGWLEGQDAGFYADAAVFRPLR